MSDTTRRIQGIAAPLPIANLDTDQIMPKQFLHGIDKKGLAQGVLWDLRFTGDGEIRPGFVLNRPEYAATRILERGDDDRGLRRAGATFHHERPPPHDVPRRHRHDRRVAGAQGRDRGVRAAALDGAAVGEGRGGPDNVSPARRFLAER